jgi:hypothetical protein
MQDQTQYIALGAGLRSFLKLNFGTQKKAARLLNISETQLTQIIKGRRKANPKLISRLGLQGFDSTLFDCYIDMNKLPAISTVDDYRFLIAKLRDLIRSLEHTVSAQKNVISSQSFVIIELKRSARDCQK